MNCPQCGTVLESETARCPGCGNVPQVQHQAEFNPYASWPLRVGATLIDLLVIALPLDVLAHAITSHSRYERAAIVLAIYTIMIVVLLSRNGRTLGNLAVRTQVVRASDHNRPCTFTQALVRTLAQVVLGLGILGGPLDIVFPVLNDSNRTLHDFIARTVVIRAAAPPTKAAKNTTLANSVTTLLGQIKNPDAPE